VYWDKVFIAFIIVVWFSWLVLMAFDTERFGGFRIWPRH